MFIGPTSGWKEIYPQLTGRKILIRGNHDRNHSNSWWMSNGFDFSCDSLVIRDILLTHEPANAIINADGWEKYGSLEANTLPHDCKINIHGHLHNIWDGFHKPERLERDKAFLDIDFTKQLKYPWQRLFAVEYTNYSPVNLEKFLSNPDKYQARGPAKKEA